MPLFLAFTILFAIYLNYQIRKSDKNVNLEESILEKETRANFTRKADISKLNYITLNFDKLPLSGPTSANDVPQSITEEILACEKEIIVMKDWKILNLTGISNTDLKLKYGPANLPFLMQYDENFSKLSRTLAKWGRLLFEAEHFSASKQVLEFAVSIQCDIEEIFILLGKIYKIEHNLPALSYLKTQLSCFDDDRRANLSQKLDELSLP